MNAYVGPVLTSGRAADAVAAAIQEENPGAKIEDHGSYLRVSVAGLCSVTRFSIERHLGRPFRMPGDLEAILASFKGDLALSEDRATWSGRAAGDAS